MPMAQALRKCPKAIVVSHDMSRYLEASARFFEILGEFSPLVESLSVDEAFVDVGGCERLFGTGEQIAQAIRKRVAADLGLIVSIGVAPTKFAAKIASDIDKPDGLRVVGSEELIDFLHALPVTRLWGVGKVTREKLESLGLRTIGAVARFPPDTLKRALGPAMGVHLHRLASGEDGREVETGHRAVSIGHEETFDHDTGEREEIRPRILRQVDRVSARLRRASLRANVVVLKIKYADFNLTSRRRTLTDPSSDSGVIGRVACELLDAVDISDDGGKRRRVRLCGVSVSGLEDRDGPRQMTLDEGGRARGERLGDTLDQIAERFGSAFSGRAIYAPKKDDSD